MAHNFSNTASIAQLDVAVTSSSTTLNVSNFTGYPSAPFWALLDRDTASHEVIEVTAVAGPVLSVVRGQGGTSATSHTVGAKLEHIIPASVAQNSDAHVTATNNVHGVAGAIVGTTASQTLSNKTYRGAGVHIYSDSDPAPTAGFKVTADTTAARDGFLAENTAADTARRGFVLRQSGTDRVEVFYDGTMKITPSGAATRPALETTTQVKAGSLQVTGASTQAAVTASGLITAQNGVTVSGGNVVLSGANAKLQFPTGASGNGTAEGQVRYRNGRLEVWSNNSRWVGAGAIVVNDSSTASFGSGSVSSASPIQVGGVTITDPGFRYYAYAQAGCEATSPASGRLELHIVLDDANSSTIYAYGSGVPNVTCIANTGVACIGPLTGSHSILVTVARAGSGTAVLTGAGQTFSAWLIPAL